MTQSQYLWWCSSGLLIVQLHPIIQLFWLSLLLADAIATAHLGARDPAHLPERIEGGR